MNVEKIWHSKEYCKRLGLSHEVEEREPDLVYFKAFILGDAPLEIRRTKFTKDAKLKQPRFYKEVGEYL